MKMKSAILMVFFMVCVSSWAGAMETAPGTSATYGVPAWGTPTESAMYADDGNLLGKASRYIHPFLSLNTYYTDNLFNTKTDEEDDFVTNIIPGIWIAVPGSQQPLIGLTTLNTAPGGLEVSRFKNPVERQFQGYALYRANIRRHNEFSEEDTENHRAEGLLQFRLKNGLEIELANIFEVEQDPYGTGDSTAMDEFTSNLFNVMATYPITNKIALRADYSNYTLSYDKDRNAFRDRDDNAVAVYLYYKLFPKTSIFLEYDFIDVNYKEDVLFDSQEHHYYFGARWKYSDKTFGRFKIGYGQKDFDKGSDRGDLIGEAVFNYQFSEKTLFFLRGTRQTNETDTPTYRDILAHRVVLGCSLKLTEKIEGRATVGYSRNEYRGGGTAENREDDFMDAGVGLGYSPLRWLALGAGYNFGKRDSSISRYNYDSNTFYLTITAAL